MTKRHKIGLMLLMAAAGLPTLGTELQNKELNMVHYEDFGAAGDGKTDDIEAIVKAHAHANAHKLPVRAKDGATYYIGGTDRTAVIQTDTDFGSARFILDDTDVENRGSHVFVVRSDHGAVDLEGISSLRKGQENLGIPLPERSMVQVWNSDVRHYIRKGLNVDAGADQTDIILVEPDGSIDPDTPVLWDFEQVTRATARPVNDKPLTITGGHFTTIANRAPSQYTYYSRGFSVQRSNVVVDGLEHHVTGEGETGAPYIGFLHISACNNVRIQNARLSGRKTYTTTGRAGKPVSMGSYGINVNRANNVTFLNCTQVNDIHDRSRWGIMASNYCKNLVYDSCTLSRFDAHKGVYNATIRNATIGHAGINAIGAGTLLIENTTVRAGRLVALRNDYGSTWEGDFIIRNSVFEPTGPVNRVVTLIIGNNDGTHDFGYDCQMPHTVTLDGLKIRDKAQASNPNSPTLFASSLIPSPPDADYPYTVTSKVILKGIETDSGNSLRVSEHADMVKSVQVVK
ncbi:MAG: right-handed parallel beta-helix repeat-containing protein [Verrucomicrobia bacterium]|nr:right-handed parallel beta-helix repeat-containing protein [Verrucomicrobiota bacterium]MCH8528657.1 right-handed parallel beta-helix repeat-containing protein [Kiritimatiellia bacterium]